MPVTSPRIALAFSGGGFRASLFHLGVLRAIAELGWLPRVDVLSTVSGGSVIGAFATLRWAKVIEAGGDVQALEQYIIHPFVELITKRSFIREWTFRVLPSIRKKLYAPDYTRTKLAAERFDSVFYDKASCSQLPQ
jgi:NTE family protein